MAEEMDKGYVGYQFTYEDFQKTLDCAKYLVVNALVQDGLLEEEEADAWAGDHAVIYTKGLFRSLKGDHKETVYSLRVVEHSKGVEFKN